MVKIKDKFKNKKFRIITIVIIVLVLLVGISSILIINKKKNSIPEQAFTYTRTVTLSKGTLNETIVSSGTIESQTTSTISLSGVNAQVSKINYVVGDYVKEGDVVMELDTSSITKQISKAKQSVDEQQEMLQESYDNALDAYYSAESSLYSADYKLSVATSNFNTAKTAVSSYQAAYDSAKQKLDKYISDQMATSKSIDDIKVEQDYIDLSNDLKEAENNLTEAKRLNNYDDLYKALTEAQTNYNNAKSTYSKAEDSYDTAAEKLDDGVDSDNLNDLYDDLSDYKLKAKSTGQITNISAVVGSTASGTLATIQDTSKLKISITIDEYDILKLKLGMKAIIETDASDDTYEGEVSMISPTASSSMGSSGFEIEVNVTSENVDNLLIGMNAEVTIILSSGDENYSVPVDAVETKEDGTSVIYVRNDAGEFEQLQVELGNNNGYYVEIISDELYEGMVVRAAADESQAQVNVEVDSEDMEEGFNFFGGQGMGGNMPSGNMPSGGGNMPSAPSGGGERPGGF